MAHVHGDKKKAVEAVAHGARGAMPGPHGPMMMGPGPHGPGINNPGSRAVKVAAASAGGSLMSRLTRHPLLMFGLGVVAGIVVYKYRKEIIATVTTVGEKGKDFVLQGKENLEDIVAESREEGESES